MSMSIEQLAAAAGLDKSANLASSGNVEFSTQINNPVQNPGNTFVSMLTDGVSEVNKTINEVNVQLERLALDKPVSTHDLMITMEKAKLELSMAIEVRNKLVEGYQELMRMQL